MNLAVRSVRYLLHAVRQMLSRSCLLETRLTSLRVGSPELALHLPAWRGSKEHYAKATQRSVACTGSPAAAAVKPGRLGVAAESMDQLVTSTCLASSRRYKCSLRELAVGGLVIAAFECVASLSAACEEVLAEDLLI